VLGDAAPLIGSGPLSKRDTGVRLLPPLLVLPLHKLPAVWCVLQALAALVAAVLQASLLFQLLLQGVAKVRLSPAAAAAGGAGG
jgi:hypothetical protein